MKNRNENFPRERTSVNSCTHVVLHLKRTLKGSKVHLSGVYQLQCHTRLRPQFVPTEDLVPIFQDPVFLVAVDFGGGRLHHFLVGPTDRAETVSSLVNRHASICKPFNDMFQKKDELKPAYRLFRASYCAEQTGTSCTPHRNLGLRNCNVHRSGVGTRDLTGHFRGSMNQELLSFCGNR